MPEYSILFIRPEDNPAEKIERALLDGFDGEIEWTRVEALFDGLRTLQERSFDLIIADLFLPDGQGLATVRHLSQQAPKTPVIVLCNARDRDVAVNAVRKGAHDFFCYGDADIANLRRAVAGGVEERRRRERGAGSGPIAGRTPDSPAGSRLVIRRWSTRSFRAWLPAKH